MGWVLIDVVVPQNAFCKWWVVVLPWLLWQRSEVLGLLLLSTFILPSTTSLRLQWVQRNQHPLALVVRSRWWADQPPGLLNFTAWFFFFTWLWSRPGQPGSSPSGHQMPCKCVGYKKTLCCQGGTAICCPEPLQIDLRAGGEWLICLWVVVGSAKGHWGRTLLLDVSHT
jgi:hypothetical protein